MHYLLFYEVVADYVERRTPLRADQWRVRAWATVVGDGAAVRV